MIHPNRSLQATGVAWPHAEFERNIARVRDAVERHADALDADITPLRRALTELRQVQGGARIIDCSGLELIVGETAATLESLCAAAHVESQSVRHADVAALHGALVGATLQLSNYIQGLAEGMPDSALLLHPTINEMRLARGHSILSEASVFLAQMGERQPDWQRQQPASGEALVPLAARLLPLYQSALLGWVRNTSEAQLCAARLGKIAERLAAALEDGPRQALWTAATAAIEALLAQGVEDVAELKRLFGRLGVQLRTLAAGGQMDGQGEAKGGKLSGAPLVESMNALSWRLAFIAVRAHCNRPRVAALRAQTQLATLAPLEQVRWRTRMHGVSPTLLETVVGELQRELDEVELQIDRVLRSGTSHGIPIAAAGLERVAAILAGLGVEFLPERTRTMAAQLRAQGSAKLVNLAHGRTQGSAQNEGPWLDLAQAIVELKYALASTLGQALQVFPEVLDAAVQTIPSGPVVHLGRQALGREILINLAQLKRVVESWLKRSGSAEAVDEVHRLLADVAAALAMVGQVQLAQRLRELAGSITQALLHMPDQPELAERFADVVAALEMQLDIGVLRQQLHAGTEMPLPAVLDDALTRFLERVRELGLPPPQVQTPQAPVGETPVEMLVETTAQSPAVEWESDDEIRGVFVEELAEIEQQMQRAVQAWLPDPSNAERLQPLRRAFHTLKGSGRTVGATVIGNYGWALENLLNRCLEGALEPGPAVIETVRAAIDAMPHLRAAYFAREEPGAELLAITARAEALLHPSPSAQVAAQDDLLATFCQDVACRLDALIIALNQPLSIEALGESIRSLHTVRGAARAVQAQAIAELAGGLEEYLDVHATAHMSPDAPVRLVLQQSVQQLRKACQLWAEQPERGVDLAEEIAQVAQLNRQLPENAQTAVADRQLAQVFANEAFDLIDQMEQSLHLWRLTPDSQHTAKELKVLAHTLGGAAQISGARALGDTAKLLSRQFDACAARKTVPDVNLFNELLAIFEGLFQMLDAFREGHAMDVTPWQSRAAALPWLAQLDETLAAEHAPGAVMPPAQLAPDLAVSELTARYQTASVQTEGANDSPPVSDTPLLERSSDNVHANLHDSTHATPFDAPAAGPDPEIYAVFRDEAHELLTQIEAAMDSLAQPAGSPQAAQALLSMQHLLHTFKGAARTCSLSMLGDVAHAMESLLGPASNSWGDPAAPGAVGVHDPLPLGVLQAATDALHGALDAIDRGSQPRLGSILAVLRAASQPTPQTAFTESSPPSEAQTSAADLAETAYATQVIIPTQDARLPSTPLPGGIDVELLQSFLAEAEELLDTAESSLAEWESLPTDYTPARELLRALHSLKGGARMTHLEGLGDATHELESLIEGLEYAREPNATALQVVREALRGVRHQVDRLLAGDSEQLPPIDGELGNVDQSGDNSILVPQSADSLTPGAAEAGWDPALFQPPMAGAATAQNVETARVAVPALDALLNQAGEVSVFRARLDEDMISARNQLVELDQAITRLKEQLRQLGQETEAQISARGMRSGAGSSAGGEADRYAEQFDPLEMDRYTRMQELSRALAESIGDIAVIHGSLDQLQTQSAALLAQQGRIATSLQEGLMQTLRVPFSRMAPRLQRLVQQASAEHGKRVELVFQGVETELDRKLYDRIGAPLEHLLRNAVVHGIEQPQQRAAQGKPLSGQIVLALRREGAQIIIELSDDGCGLDLDAIRRVAVARGLLAEHATLSDAELGHFIFTPGFSTARSLSQDAGRGVGMDVALSEIRGLGGSLDFTSRPGRGLRLVLRLPLAMVVSRGLLVEAGTETYAVPVPSIEAIVRLPAELAEALLSPASPDVMYEYGGEPYRVQHLADWVGTARASVREGEVRHAILLRQSRGDESPQRVALIVDRLLGHRELVSKPVGALVSAIPGIVGATLLADGRVVIILDLPGLMASRSLDAEPPQVAEVAVSKRQQILIVDDSITVRRVTERLLDRNGYATRSARDGLEAIEMLQEERPAAILLDIEMPRADGFEVAGFVRNTPELVDTPIIVITSRSGDKHRERAAQYGIARYLVKPYQEDVLLLALQAVLQTEAA